MTKEKNEELLEAADKGDLEGVKQALDSGANINTKDKGGMSALSLAVRSGFIEVIKYLISKGIKITNSDIQIASIQEMMIKGLSPNMLSSRNLQIS